jgi:hypothetical protein
VIEAPKVRLGALHFSGTLGLRDSFMASDLPPSMLWLMCCMCTVQLPQSWHHMYPQKACSWVTVVTHRRHAMPVTVARQVCVCHSEQLKTHHNGWLQGWGKGVRVTGQQHRQKPSGQLEQCCVMLASTLRQQQSRWCMTRARQHVVAAVCCITTAHIRTTAIMLF